MKTCPRCEIKHEKNGLYCSHKCANVREWSEERKKQHRDLFLKINENLSESEYKKRFRTPAKRAAQRKATEANVNKSETRHLGEFDDLSRNQRRKRVIHDQSGKCNRCKNDSWLGEPIMLELEHKDGNRYNNSRDNLECLCPNCHSQTKTWRGRNNKNKGKKPISVGNFPSISSYLRSEGKVAGGKNFETVKKKFGL